MSLIARLFPPQADFYQLLLEQSQKTLEGIYALATYMHNGNLDTGREITGLEQEADDLRKELIDALDRTFITPFDREDIFQLSGAIDDIIDYATTTVEEMEIYMLHPDDLLCGMVDILLEATVYLNNAMIHLKTNKAVASENAFKSKKMENEMETLYRVNLSKLVINPDFCHVFKMREVYRHLSNLADKIDLAANVITHIIVKSS